MAVAILEFSKKISTEILVLTSTLTWLWAVVINCKSGTVLKEILMGGWVLIFCEVEVSQLGGDLDIDDEGSEQNVEPL
jgi:hypothetical protein